MPDDWMTYYGLILEKALNASRVPIRPIRPMRRMRRLSEAGDD